MKQLQNFQDFCDNLLEAGFSGASPNPIFSVVPFSWNEPAPYPTAVHWHTGNRETDPWEWRIRVLEERKDIAYAKVFYKKAGFITREFYPYFLAIRQTEPDFLSAYQNGTISQIAKRVYEAIESSGSLPMHEIRKQAKISTEDKGKFQTALAELQERLFLTISGRAFRRNAQEEDYGWSSTVLTTTRSFWGEEVFEESAALSPQLAREILEKRISELSPNATPTQRRKFLCI
jgi:hypothetical protein